MQSPSAAVLVQEELSLVSPGHDGSGFFISGAFKDWPGGFSLEALPSARSFSHWAWSGHLATRNPSSFSFRSQWLMAIWAWNLSPPDVSSAQPDGKELT